MSSTPDVPTGPVLDVHSHATLDLGNGLEAGTNLPVAVVPPWSVERALDIQDEVGISSCILSMPEAAIHGDDATNCARARTVNEYLTEIREQHPDRFGALAVLPLTTMDGALDELRYALDTLGMDAVSLPTSVDNVYLGDSAYDPLFEELDRRAATVFVHPVQATASKAVSLGINQSMLEFPFDTTRMITNMIFSDAVRRFPKMNFIASHGGGTLPFLISRLMTLEPLTGAGPGRGKLTPDEILEGAGWFHYDLTAATSRVHLSALSEIVPPSRLLVGFDIPFMPVPTMRPAIASIAAWEGFEDDDVAAILHGNAARLFPSVEARRLGTQAA